MSKKETEFDRYDRMKRMEKEQEVKIRKEGDFGDSEKVKKGGKAKAAGVGSRKNREHDNADAYDDEFDYVN